MTEDEAKTKWCPMARVAYSGGSYNRNSLGTLGHVDTQDILCIGSRCMMFRAAWVEHQANLDEPAKLMKTFYCGIGGRP